MAIPLLAIKAIIASESESSKAAESINKWNKTKEYKKGSLVYFEYHFWESLVIQNKGNTPGEDNTKWTDLGLLDLSVSSVADLSSINTGYLPAGTIVPCTSDGGHYVYLPSGVSTDTAPTVGSWYLKEQIDFDARYKVGSHKMVFSTDDLPQPVAPASCTWKVDTSYNNRSPWIASGVTAGTLYDGSLPNIYGNLNGNLIDDGGSWGASGAFYTNGVSRSRSWEGASGIACYNFGFAAGNSNSIYKASAGGNIVRPTSVVVHIYKRTS